MDPQNRSFATRILRYADPAALDEAARLILGGEVVAVPTETVYGLAADATNPKAVARIYAAKGRPAFNPLIVHVLDIDHARSLGAYLDNPKALALAEQNWPGPLTLVVKINPFTQLAPAVTAGLDSVALRSPAHPAMRDLLRATGRPLAAPSANASGRVSPTRAEHVLASLGGRIPLILDAGETEHGLESTILKVSGREIIELRPGPVRADDAAVGAAFAGGERPRLIEAPGQLASHYAPSKPLRLDALEARGGEWHIGFGAVAGDDSLSRSGDLAEAAARLFAALHRAEAEPNPAIAVAPIPDEGLGAAINDRLRRAAAPR